MNLNFNTFPGGFNSNCRIRAVKKNGFDANSLRLVNHIEPDGRDCKAAIPTYNQFVAFEDDYAVILDKSGLHYRVQEHYLVVGAAPSSDAKRVYVVVIQSQLFSLLENLVPWLATGKFSFAIIKNRFLAKYMTYGRFGADQIGNVVQLHLPADRFDMELQELLVLTRGFKGPVLPNLTGLGGVLFTDHISTDKKQPRPAAPRIKLFNGKYLVLTTIKPDPKGAVMAGIYRKGFLGLGRFVMKEGVRHMWSDDAARDIRDQLEWQGKVQKDLYGLIRVPKVIDFFEENGNAYLVMEYIKAKPLGLFVEKVYGGRTWLDLPLAQKIRLVDVLLEVLGMVNSLHTKGYVHRDLNHANIMVNSRDWVYLIDFELAHNYKLNYPYTVMEFGTAGYMSPEQKTTESPGVQQDNYALGALMMLFFANRPPVEQELEDRPGLKKYLYGYVGHDSMANLISKALNDDPYRRPSVPEITMMVLKYRSWLIRFSLVMGLSIHL